ncbi:MAG TPA: sialate O-acetylesterase [Bacteroidales bacterium]|nr:sialate O-acetylesterase [Bacteroidales bacterium]
MNKILNWAWRANCLTVVMVFLAVGVAHGQVTLPRLVSDGMVLQRGNDTHIWGWANPGEAIAVEFVGKKFSTNADGEGNWEVNLGNLEPGGPHRMVITGSNVITLNDILIGDVWVASGQSNMELPMRRLYWVYPEVIEQSENPTIRQFWVPEVYFFDGPRKNHPGGRWISANPETVTEFYAVAYFFALELYERLGVPIGIISSALGGSPAEAWMSEDALKAFPVHYNELQRLKNENLRNEITSSDNNRINAWYAELNALDKGYKGPHSWREVETDTSKWQPIAVPDLWRGTSLEGTNGVVWFRKEIEVPQQMTGMDAKIILGCIVDADSVFINGRFVGTTSFQFPPRRYNIPAGILKPGKNTVVVRVISNQGHGGFVPDKIYAITTNTDTLQLGGEWRYRVGAVMPPLAGQTFIRWKPAGLYNGMIAPMHHYRIKGVIWYQGESNAGRPAEYHSLFPAVISNWRNKWQQGDFPFLFVQLANFMEDYDHPTESNWALLREAQLKTLAVPATGMAVTIDIGEWNDIHPLNKKDVGRRLALAARKVAYGESELVHSGPIFKSKKIRGNRIILTFDNAVRGLKTSDGNALKEFAIAGEDHKFVWADARIRGNKLIVRSNEVRNPVAVRYAWANNPDEANLVNSEGLPASPFRTDAW